MATQLRDFHGNPIDPKAQAAVNVEQTLTAGTEIGRINGIPLYAPKGGGGGSSEMSPDFLLPSNIYVLDGVQRNLWHQSLMNRWNPNDFYLQFKGTASYQRRTPLVASLKSGNTDGKTIIANIVDYRTMTELASKTATIKVGTPNDNSLSAIKVQFMGSSTVQLLYFETALETYASNYTLVGLRHKPNDNTVRHEGRGGAALANYANIATNATSHFYPYWQPSGNYRFWGVTDFWKYAKLHPDDAGSTSTQQDGSKPYYNGCYVPEALAKFDSNGLLVSPQSGDIMFFTSENKYKVYNGSSWVDTTKNAYTWGFDYSKYLAMWGFECPDLVCITLGSNDFRYASFPLDFATWNSNMDAIIASMKTANPNIKVVICNQGPFGNYGKDGEPSHLMDYKMWLHLQDIIATYDNRQNENIYVLAQGSEISAEYGFTPSTGDSTKVTDLYQGTERLAIKGADIVHPMLSLPNMGIPITAFLQYIRK